MAKMADFDELVLEGVQKGLVEAMANLYRVFTSPGADEAREAAFLRGVDKHLADYERMIELISEK